MTELQVADAPLLQERHRVVELYLKGTPVSAIAKTVGIKVTEVKEHLAKWQEMAREDKGIKDRAYQAITNMTEHFNMIIKELWEVAEEAKDAGDNDLRAKTLKMIADAEKSRVDLLQKAGVIDDKHMGDEMAKISDRQDKLKAILKEVVGKCPQCAPEVARRLSEAYGTAEVVIVRE